MIDKKTVLVLGAGASCHLGFPLGQELIEDIYRFVYGKSRGIRKKMEVGYETLVDCEFKNSDLLERFLDLSEFKKDSGQKYSSKDIEEFADRLFRADPPSIDFFLEVNPQYSFLGKMCIIFCLSRYEDKDSWLYSPSKFPEKLRDDFPRFGWYRVLWHQLLKDCASIKDLKENKITILTFNYDRSLEYYLIRAIQSFFNVNDNLAAEVFDSVKIKHSYGKLGKLNYEMSGLVDYPKTPEDCMMESNDFTPWELSIFFRLMGDIGQYGMAKDDFSKEAVLLSQKSRDLLVERYKKAIEDILIFYESTDDSNGDTYLADFSKVEKVYFLGFGYHDLNIKALGLDKGILPTGVKVYGTAVGKTDKETDTIKYYIAGFSSSPDNVDIRNEWKGIDSVDLIGSFLKNVVPLE